MRLNRPLSSLELTALGIVSKRGPCRAHAVVREFAGSQTFAYRSGAGSVYPLLQRLAKAGLLEVDGRQYRLSPSGEAALRDWLRPPLPTADVSTSLDLLRSRAYFLKLLSPAEVSDWADDALDKLEGLLEKVRQTIAAYREAGDPFSEMAMKGAEAETMARIEWLKDLKRQFGAG